MLRFGGEFNLMRSSIKHEPVQINAEGELVGGVFCEYCGGLNRADVAECEHCHEHIADQGPDLRSRLQRIRRYASGAPQQSGPKRDDWLNAMATGFVYGVVPLPTTRNKGKPSKIALWLKDLVHNDRLTFIGAWFLICFPYIFIFFVIAFTVMLALLPPTFF